MCVILGLSTNIHLLESLAKTSELKMIAIIRAPRDFSSFSNEEKTSSTEKAMKKVIKI